MSHVDFKKWHYFCTFHVEFQITKCRLSNLRKGPCHVTNILMSIGLMSHVNFKKRPCRPVDFKGQGPILTPSCWTVRVDHSRGEVNQMDL